MPADTVPADAVPPDTVPPDAVARFAGSPNRLFATTVVHRRRLSPGFVRLGLTGPGLGGFETAGRDLRVKILVPGPDGPAPQLLDGASEARWRATWRGLPPERRPVMRSYTAPRVFPVQRLLELDFFLHDPAGPASDWAARAAEGDRLLVSGPHVDAGDPSHGVQWAPGAATRLLLGADETAFPAVAGILATLRPDDRATLLLEAGDARDAAPFVDGSDPRLDVRHVPRGDLRGGEALVAATRTWLSAHGTSTAAAGADAYAWFATESTRVAEVRRLLHDAGIAPERVHTQGYWIDRAGAARAG